MGEDHPKAAQLGANTLDNARNFHWCLTAHLSALAPGRFLAADGRIIVMSISFCSRIHQHHGSGDQHVEQGQGQAHFPAKGHHLVEARAGQEARSRMKNTMKQAVFRANQMKGGSQGPCQPPKKRVTMREEISTMPMYSPRRRDPTSYPRTRCDSRRRAPARPPAGQTGGGG